MQEEDEVPDAHSNRSAGQANNARRLQRASQSVRQAGAAQRRRNEESKNSLVNGAARRNRSHEEERKQPQGLVEGRIQVNPGNGGRQEKEDSCSTVVSEIPDESESKFGNDFAAAVKGHRYKQEIDYDLKILSIQWQKDSHGLFDYDMKQITKADLSVSKS